MRPTARQYRAIGFYAKDHKLNLTLSVLPTVTFLRDKEVIDVPIETVMNEYDAYKKEDARLRASERRRLKRQAKEVISE